MLSAGIGDVSVIFQQRRTQAMLTNTVINIYIIIKKARLVEGNYTMLDW